MRDTSGLPFLLPLYFLLFSSLSYYSSSLSLYSFTIFLFLRFFSSLRCSWCLGVVLLQCIVYTLLPKPPWTPLFNNDESNPFWRNQTKPNVFYNNLTWLPRRSRHTQICSRDRETASWTIPCSPALLCRILYAIILLAIYFSGIFSIQYLHPWPSYRDRLSCYFFPFSFSAVGPRWGLLVRVRRRHVKKQ